MFRSLTTLKTPLLSQVGLIEINSSLDLAISDKNKYRSNVHVYKFKIGYNFCVLKQVCRFHIDCLLEKESIIQNPSENRDLPTTNIQSYSFKMLQKALEDGNLVLSSQRSDTTTSIF